VDEESSQHTRLLEGKCPPIGAPLTQAIAVSEVNIKKVLQIILPAKKQSSVAVERGAETVPLTLTLNLNPNPEP
jgi:hypothetical protein